MSPERSQHQHTPDPSTEAWQESRSGAWAARGFHYQHLVSALILVRQWARLAPAGHLVPEGLEDCVVETSAGQVWIQTKSRAVGPFRTAEIRGLFDAMDAKKARIPGLSDIQTALVLEQPDSAGDAISLDGLFDAPSEKVIVCPQPNARSWTS